METIANYPDLASAQVAQTMLAAEGIEASIPDEYIVGLDWRMATALQGIRLQVGPDDAARAQELLGELFVEAEGPAGDTCPRCGSQTVALERWHTRLKAATMIAPMLLLVWPFVRGIQPHLVCSACGNKWREV